MAILHEPQSTSNLDAMISGDFAPEARNGFVRWRIVSPPRQDQGLTHLVPVDFTRRGPPFISDL
jgi:hypothetical protein